MKRGGLNRHRADKEYRSFLTGLRKVDPDLAKFILERLGRDGRNFTHLRGRLRYLNHAAYKALVTTSKLGKVAMDAAKKLGPCNKRGLVKLQKDLWGICEGIETFYSCTQGFVGEEQPRHFTVYFKGEKASGDVDKDIVAVVDEVMHIIGGKRIWNFGFNNRVVVCELTSGQVAVLRQDNRVEKVVEEEIATAQYGEYAPQPPFVEGAENVDWGVTRLNVSYAWDKGIKGAGVKLAIIDTGCDFTHIDLIDRYKGGYNFVSAGQTPMDDRGHGTHCAGIALGSDNGIGYTGVAPEADLYAVKVLNSKGSGSFGTVAAGIDWCRVNKMDIMSLSLGGGYRCNDPLATAVLDAWNAGILVVAAAGNPGTTEECDDNDCVIQPAVCTPAIAVASTDIDDYASLFSARGPQLELAAPGEGICACGWGDMYGDGDHYIGSAWYRANGTSMACPHVAGACALIKCWFPDATNYEVREWLRDNAYDL